MKKEGKPIILAAYYTQGMLWVVYAELGLHCTRRILYSVYDVLSVNSSSSHGETGRDDLTLCSAMITELWIRKREMGDEDENDVITSGFEKPGERLA
jgi:hypothetical protein